MQLSYFLYPQHAQTSTFLLDTDAPAVEAVARSFVFLLKLQIDSLSIPRNEGV